MEKKRARIVIVGGGFGGLFTALDLEGTCDVTLISDADHFLFTPMLYEYFSGEVEEWHIAPKYKELLDESVNLIRDEVINIDPTRRTVTLKDQSENLTYDVLVLAVGGVTNFAGVAGAAARSPTQISCGCPWWTRSTACLPIWHHKTRNAL